MLKPLFQNQKIKFEELKEGFHHLVVKTAKVAMSKSNKQMLVVEFDCTSDDVQPNYFGALARTKEGKEKWPFSGTKYLVIYKDDNICNAFFQSFCEAVEASNPGFTIDWDLEENVFGRQFEGLIVGARFKSFEQEYQGLKSYPVLLWYFVDNNLIDIDKKSEDQSLSGGVETEVVKKSTAPSLAELLK